jgi:hypothetical protein
MKAVLRIILGTSQVMGATVSLILLVQTGVNGLSLAAILITVLLTLASKLQFHGT